MLRHFTGQALEKVYLSVAISLIGWAAYGIYLDNLQQETLAASFVKDGRQRLAASLKQTKCFGDVVETTHRMLQRKIKWHRHQEDSAIKDFESMAAT